MGSLSGPTFTNIFLCFHEMESLKTCRKVAKSVYLKDTSIAVFDFLKTIRYTVY